MSTHSVVLPDVQHEATCGNPQCGKRFRLPETTRWHVRVGRQTLDHVYCSTTCGGSVRRVQGVPATMVCPSCRQDYVPDQHTRARWKRGKHATNCPACRQLAYGNWYVHPVRATEPEESDDMPYNITQCYTDPTRRLAHAVWVETMQADYPRVRLYCAEAPWRHTAADYEIAHHYIRPRDEEGQYA